MECPHTRTRKDGRVSGTGKQRFRCADCGITFVDPSRRGNAGTRKQDLTGRRFGHLVVVEAAVARNGRAGWRCMCDCGRAAVCMTNSLNSGHTSSCGRCIKTRACPHGMCNSRTYRIWQGMKARCLNSDNRAYPQYGGAGITVCERWLKSFQSFISDMGECPPDHSIDRFPDQRGNYEPGNCRWATRIQQQRNTKSNRIVWAFGEGKCVADWLDDLRCVVGEDALRSRIDRGWHPELAIVTPLKIVRSKDDVCLHCTMKEQTA